MKRYLTDLLIAIPFALGLILTIFCVVNALGSPDNSDRGFIAVVLGMVGIPLLFASTAAILRRANRQALES